MATYFLFSGRENQTQQQRNPSPPHTTSVSSSNVPREDPPQNSPEITENRGSEESRDHRGQESPQRLPERSGDGIEICIKVREEVIRHYVPSVRAKSVVEIKQEVLEKMAIFVISILLQLFGRELESGKQVRFIYRGRLMADEDPLSIYPFHENNNIHAVISERNPNDPLRQRQPQQQQAQNSYTSYQGQQHQEPIALRILGSGRTTVLYGMIGGMIAGLWTLYFNYGDKYFSNFSVLALIVITFGFLSTVFSNNLRL